MPVPVSGQRGPNCWTTVKYGFFTGLCIGTVGGFLIGGFYTLRRGLRGKELITNVGKSMLQLGGSFGGFMAIGHGIRCF